MRQSTIRTLFVIAGWMSLGLGLIGAFLPILPTTPLVILAAYFFSKGSTRLHQWLITRPYLGNMILEWEQHRVIRMRAKLMSTAVIIPLFAYTLLFVQVHVAVKIIVAMTGVAVLAFIWTRASLPGKSTNNDVAEPTGPAGDTRNG
jgi:uncharacterized membrane protein YbaN (DUF454 family)